MFETLHIVSKFFGIWDNKIIALFGKLLSELSQMPSARPQESFAEHHFFYQRNYVFCLKRDLQQFFCPVAKKLSRWAKTAMHVFTGNICGNFTLKNCFFFFNCSDFERRNMDFFWKNIGTFVKTVAKASVRKNFRKNVFG